MRRHYGTCGKKTFSRLCVSVPGHARKYCTVDHVWAFQRQAKLCRHKTLWELSWSLFPNLDYIYGFWKRHLPSNTLRRVSVSLQGDKITQKTFKGQEQHTEGGKERDSERGRNSVRSTRVGKMSTTRESPVPIRVRESRRREHSLWQQFELFSPFPSSVASRHELPPFGQGTLLPVRTDGGLTTAAARRRDVREVYTYGTQKRYAGRWRGRFLLPTYCWLGGDCSLSHVSSHCSLWRTRREKKKKRPRTGRVPTSLRNVDAMQRAPLFVPP